MTTEPTISRPDPSDPAESAPSRLSQRAVPPESFDSGLVDRTKLQIRQLVAEIEKLASSECSKEEFFEGFLVRLTQALASVGGAVWWTGDERGEAKLLYQINLSQTGLHENEQAQQTHSRLLAKLLATGEPTLVPPRSGAGDKDNAGNPTDSLLIVCPLMINQSAVGLVEIFQRTGAGPTTQRGYLRFVAQMCELANTFLCQEQLREFQKQQELWHQLDQLTRRIHADLNPEQCAYHIANEGRRLIGTDRVAVALRSGRRFKVVSVSGLDTIERRADQIKKLDRLVSVVVQAGEPTWWVGDETELAPQIEEPLQQYVDSSHCKSIGIIPLYRSASDPDTSDETSEASTRPREAIGALVVEQLKDCGLNVVTRRRAEAVATHGEIALTNAVEFHQIPLLPLWRAAGAVLKPFRSEYRTRTLAALLVLAAVIAFFGWYPYPFTLGAKGQLVPDNRQEIFAQVDGVLKEILVDGSNQLVKRGQPLARMTNHDLMAEIENLKGQIHQMEEQRHKLSRAQHEQLEIVDDIMLEGERRRAEVSEQSLRRELAIKLQEAENLEVRSPLDGRIVNWKVQDNLRHRPVNKGQSLMTIVAPDSTWSIELEIPERRLGHLIQYLDHHDDHPLVTFALASHPGQEYTGRLTQVDLRLDVYSDEGNAALATIEFDNAQVHEALRRAGTRVNAQIHCGQRSIGYVWFHEFFETVRSAWIYWF